VYVELEGDAGNPRRPGGRESPRIKERPEKP